MKTKKYLDTEIMKALDRKQKVTLYLCRNIEGGFGIKIDGKIIARNMAWENFEYPLEKCK